jgi:hypothetical protein
LTKVDVLVRFLSICRSGNGTGERMAVSLTRALMDILADWPDDLHPERRRRAGRWSSASAMSTRNSNSARNFTDWQKTLAASGSGAVALEPISPLAQHWGDVDPRHARGLLPFWRPLMIEVLRTFFDRGASLAVTGFGDVAAGTLRQVSFREADRGDARIPRDHPTRAEPALCRSWPWRGSAPGPLRVVFRRAPIGARDNAGRVW